MTDLHHIINKSYKRVLAQIIPAFISVLFVSACMIFIGVKFSLTVLSIAGVIVALIFTRIFIKIFIELKSVSFWVDTIKNKPENVVWVKPILTERVVVIPLYEYREFELLTKSKNKITIKADTKEEMALFVKNILLHLPHAHIGYSDRLVRIYKKNSENFISVLDTKNLYKPVNTVLSQ